MSTSAKKKADADADSQSMFNIQVCSKDGQLLSEYTLTPNDHDVQTLKAAEHCARENLSDYDGEPLIVVVSEETLLKLRQVQTECRSRKSRLIQAANDAADAAGSGSTRASTKRLT